MELLREIIYPTKNTYTLNLPDEMIGKQIEVISFEIEKKKIANPNKNKKEEIKSIFKDFQINLSNFKFDRDEANNYD